VTRQYAGILLVDIPILNFYDFIVLDNSCKKSMLYADRSELPLPQRDRGFERSLSSPDSVSRNGYYDI
jgi:hypothetical protein